MFHPEALLDGIEPDLRLLSGLLSRFSRTSATKCVLVSSTSVFVVIFYAKVTRKGCVQYLIETFTLIKFLKFV